VNARIALVGEAPGADEDRIGVPFIGRAGQLLRERILSSGLSPDDLWITNTYHCRPPDNRIALAAGSPCPYIHLLTELYRLPSLRVVVALGRTALTFFRPGTEQIPVRILAAQDVRFHHFWVVGSYHPSAALRGSSEQIIEAIDRSLARAIRYSGQAHTSS
jgi:DNA polymerase